MAATRTQIYLTNEQRRRLDALVRREGRPLAALIRDAVEDYLTRAAPDPGQALEETFGIAPEFEVPPRQEWAERERKARNG